MGVMIFRICKQIFGGSETHQNQNRNSDATEFMNKSHAPLFLFIYDYAYCKTDDAFHLYVRV